MNLKKKIIKRPVTLLEVLIAFFLVTMCAIPLIYPHTYIYLETKRFVNEINLDRQVTMLYAEVMNRLFKQEIAWQDLEKPTLQQIDEPMLERAFITGYFPWKGVYKFVSESDKKDSEDKDHVYKMQLIFAFVPKDFPDELTEENVAAKGRIYQFPFVLERKTEEIQPEETPKEQKNEKEK